jgi:hypothetical protein
MLYNILYAGIILVFFFSGIYFSLFSLSLNPSDAPVPYAIFGDFNFRLDTHRLLPVNEFALNISKYFCYE